MDVVWGLLTLRSVASCILRFVTLRDDRVGYVSVFLVALNIYSNQAPSAEGHLGEPLQLAFLHSLDVPNLGYFFLLESPARR
jgi:hypothetical protein